MGETVTNINTIDTICTECFRIMSKRAPATCPTCGGKIIRVPLGQGGRVVAILRERRNNGDLSTIDLF